MIVLAVANAKNMRGRQTFMGVTNFNAFAHFGDIRNIKGNLKLQYGSLYT
jgi:hypothetical protein